ncbi:MAG: HU family DNA-binding protein [Deltaproteobacteria bacterium]|nr:HU family DNA-binding protein [Deltaproteobacteria bacterium]
MTLTKEYFVRSIYKELNLTKEKSAKLIESFLEIIKKTLENGEDMLISGFGKFCVKNNSDRRGRSPRAGDNQSLGSNRIVTFKCSPVLEDKVNREQ